MKTPMTQQNKNDLNVYIETQFIIKVVDDNINVDKKNKTEDVKKAVRSENVEEKLEDVVNENVI